MYGYVCKVYPIATRSRNLFDNFNLKFINRFLMINHCCNPVIFIHWTSVYYDVNAAKENFLFGYIYNTYNTQHIHQLFFSPLNSEYILCSGWWYRVVYLQLLCKITTYLHISTRVVQKIKVVEKSWSSNQYKHFPYKKCPSIHRIFSTRHELCWDQLWKLFSSFFGAHITC